jgi:hypothetical protein
LSPLHHICLGPRDQCDHLNFNEAILIAAW